ncbi:MAG TPA: crosslink repair DNA glycosylase YcaQ family protein [Polyangiaceae bacterium]
MTTPSLEDLRRFALARTLFGPTTLERALARLGFVQADPIRAPARAQDLSLYQRVKDYRAGDLERRYERLEVEEDFFVNYGFVARTLQALMHPRSGFERYGRSRARQAEQVLAFVRERKTVHPREVERKLGSGTEENYWGGRSNTTTRLLDALHYRGFLRVARREAGIRVYAVSRLSAARERDSEAGLDALIDAAVRKYAPLPAASLVNLIARLRYAAPQWRSELRRGLQRAKLRLARAHAGGVDWYWPADESALLSRRGSPAAVEGRVLLLSPFDPLVWDRRRFESFWGWPYRFEAYTPVAKRKFGYYALPLFWNGRAVGWANLDNGGERLSATFGYVSGKPPRDKAFQRALAAELARFERFLGARSG